MRKILTVFSVLIIFHCGNGENADIKYRFIYNSDGTDILSNSLHGKRQISVADVYNNIDILKDTGITTFMICTGSLMPYYDSEYERSLGTPRETAAESDSGYVPPENIRMYEKNIRILKEADTDVIRLCIKRARFFGMEGFLTIRLNDLHFTVPSITQTGFQSDFWLDHPEYRMGSYPGWHADGAFNFAHKGVRDYKLNMIKELCDNYDFDGLELDFMRFLVYFPRDSGQHYSGLMTDFVKDVRTAVKGKSGIFSVRVPPNLDVCRDKGLNVDEWISEGLVDFVTVAAHWIDDPALPVRKFRKNAGAADIPLYASFESGIFDPRQYRTEGDYRGAAAHCYGQGADGLYVFNFFLSEYNLGKNPDPEGAYYSTVRTPMLLKEINRPKNLTGRNKVYSISDGTEEYGYAQNTPLPVNIAAGENIKIDFDVFENTKSQTPENIYLYVNGSELSKLNITFNRTLCDKIDSAVDQITQNSGKGQERLFRIAPGDLIHGGNEINFENKGLSELTIFRIKIITGYGKTEIHGKF